MNRNYLKEEEFLDEFYNWASIAANELKGAWNPNYSCDDRARRNRDYFMKSGHLSQLVFQFAALTREPDGEVHVQILLESAVRIINVKVGEREGTTYVKVLLDKSKCAL